MGKKSRNGGRIKFQRGHNASGGTSAPSNFLKGLIVTSGLIASFGIADYIALGVIVLLIFAAAVYHKKRKKKGGCGTCGGCSGCPYAGNCEKKKDEK